MATIALNAPWYFEKKSHLPLDVTWPRRIFSHQHIPAEFREVFPNSSEFPYAIYCPGEDTGMFTSSPRQFVALTDKELVVMSRDTHRKQITSTAVPLETIIRIEYGAVLLQSWLNIRNASQKIAIPFPSVAGHLFKPLLDTILARDSQEASPESGQQPMEAALDDLKDANLKLFNAARTYLDRQQAIVATAYQPQVELSSKRIFGVPVYTKYATAHLAVLTKTALILIKESQAIASSQTRPVYGGSMTYLPVRQIRHIAFEDVPEKLNCVMNVILTDNSSIRTEFATDMVSNFEYFEEACLNQCVRKP